MCSVLIFYSYVSADPSLRWGLPSATTVCLPCLPVRRPRVGFPGICSGFRLARLKLRVAWAAFLTGAQSLMELSSMPQWDGGPGDSAPWSCPRGPASGPLTTHLLLVSPLWAREPLCGGHCGVCNHIKGATDLPGWPHRRSARGVY